MWRTASNAMREQPQPRCRITGISGGVLSARAVPGQMKLPACKFPSGTLTSTVTVS